MPSSTSKEPATAADTIDNVALAGTVAAVFALKMAILRYAVIATVGAYPDPFSGAAGAIWWTCFVAGIGVALASYAFAIIMLIRGE